MTTQMKCHYEVLCVERDASPEDLKKAYRKLALKWHPDKNPDNIEECTAQFRIYKYYDVLIDPQERAWYDKHREAILRGGLGHGDKYEDESLDVFQYFNANCFSGYNDDEKGFYAVYTEVFRVIAEEDKTFMDDDEEYEEHPEFGIPKSVYEEIVAPFYGFWESYCTAKSYVWVEKYDTREAPDRRCRRLMEAENKKLRDAAKKNRNEEVRKLLEERAEEISRKAKENREKHLKEDLKHFEDYKENSFSAALEAELAQLESNLAEHFGEEQNNEDEDESSIMVIYSVICYLFMLFLDKDEEEYYDAESCDEEEEEEEYYDDLFCVACNKSFKSEKSYVNHEKSKKHKEGVAFLKEEMKESGDGIDEPLTLNEDDNSDEEEIISSSKLSKKQKKKKKQQQKNISMVDEDDLVESTSSLTVNDKEEDENKVKQSNKSKKERRKEKELQEKLKNKTAEECQPESVTDSENKDVDQNEDRLKADLPETNGVSSLQ
ncbi:DNAJA5 [Mytilus edulis]|uniref:DnaJ homolog subfamily C member 21 n=1 Tax=Mytilus edulis TaxID=6550 RepID=A0A8S3QGH1_MYTED|nr:DNAJA5 [Mytilus edulis]